VEWADMGPDADNALDQYHQRHPEAPAPAWIQAPRVPGRPRAILPLRLPPRIPSALRAPPTGLERE
jgi:hypothetical protein